MEDVKQNIDDALNSVMSSKRSDDFTVKSVHKYVGDGRIQITLYPFGENDDALKVEFECIDIGLEECTDEIDELQRYIQEKSGSDLPPSRERNENSLVVGYPIPPELR